MVLLHDDYFYCRIHWKGWKTIKTTPETLNSDMDHHRHWLLQYHDRWW